MKLQMVLFTSPAMRDNALFRRWVGQRQYLWADSLTLSSADFRSRWNAQCGPDKLGVYIDYPIEDLRDLDTLDCFIEQVREQEGRWYYAPRPNDYLELQKPQLVGVYPMRLLRESFESQLRRFAVARLDQLPVVYRGQLKQGLKTALQKLKRPKSPGRIQPQVATPAQLQPLGRDWQSWAPSADVLERDLLEKAEHFFPVPRGIHVILLNRCNLKCVMCPYHSPKYAPHHTSNYFKKTQMMSRSLFEKLADYAGQNAISLQFGQIEEPLIHSEIFDFFKLAKARGVPYIHLTTNGTLLDEEKAMRLAESGIDSVMFSVDAATPETYKAIRGKDLEQLETNIRHFISLTRDRKVKITLSFILQDQAKHEREAFLEKWQQLGVDSITYYVLTAHDPKTGKHIRTEEIYKKGTRYPCASPWMQSVVFPDGDISLCCKTMTDIGWRGMVSVGNLSCQSFEEIWLGDAYRRVRQELLANRFQEFDVCSDCQIWSASSYFQEDTANYTRIYNETLETYHFNVK